MKITGKIVLFGFLIWMIPFLVAIGIFSIHENNRPLFESIMAVTVTLAATLFSVLFFQKRTTNFRTAGLLLGLLWFAISFGIDLIMFSFDLIMFSWGPMKMPFWDYVSDIGITYLIIPIVTIGIGLLLKMRKTV